MKSTKEMTHAFIVRIWVESRELKDAEAIWRGAIEPVLNHERVYFDHLDEMNAFFTEYIQQLLRETKSDR